MINDDVVINTGEKVINTEVKSTTEEILSASIQLKTTISAEPVEIDTNSFNGTINSEKKREQI